MNHYHPINVTLTNVLLQRVGVVLKSVYGVKCMMREVYDGGNLNRTYIKYGVYTRFSDSSKFNWSHITHVKSGLKKGAYKRGLK